MILVIDNYDSFVHNLARHIRQLGCETRVVRNDQIEIRTIEKLAPQAIVISPGPCTPDDAGACVDIVKTLGSRVPILGVCLGHQIIVQAMGGIIEVAHEPIHGRSSEVFHTDSPLFADIPSPFLAGRYHSLVAKRSAIPAEFDVSATTGDGVVMAVQHQSLPLVGLQFHPESIMTEWGYQLLFNFLKIANIQVPASTLLALNQTHELDKSQSNRVTLQRSPRLTIQERP